MNKRGLSTVIATLIIILIVLVAVGIIWVVVRNIIQRGTGDISFSQFTIDLEIENVRQTPSTLNVRVKRNPGEGELAGITFLVYDGENTYTFVKPDATLEQLERKTFILDYNGTVVRVSIAPMYMTSEGKILTGSIVDIYYMSFSETGGDEGGEEEECITDCAGKECGYDGCEGFCGDCETLYGAGYFCTEGTCGTEPCIGNCSGTENICEGNSFSDGCEGICYGELSPEQDCGLFDCGPSPVCGFDCGECEQGYHCELGICVVTCEPDCGTRECGLVPNGCGGPEATCPPGCNELIGDYCNITTGMCEACTPDCDIFGYECGPVPNGCGTSCGTCNETAGEFCESGFCIVEEMLNSGSVYSIWPIDIGMYFDSPDLPKNGVSYTNYYVKFTTGLEDRCLQIREFITPVVPEVYNLSYIRFVTTSTAIQPNDQYQIWETYEGCNP